MLNTYRQIATVVPEGIDVRLAEGTLCDELDFWHTVDRTLYAIANLPATTTEQVLAILVLQLRLLALLRLELEAHSLSTLAQLWQRR